MKRQTQVWRKWSLPPADLVVDEWDDRLYVWQDNRCAWCGCDPSRAGQGLVEDHCHLTGLVRGYLCRQCNQREGVSYDTEWEVWREGENAANAIGHYKIYRSPWGGGTPLSPQSTLTYYSHAEKAEWLGRIVADLAAGAPWPEDAPWTENALARKEREDESLREAMKLAFPPGWIAKKDGAA